jgi:hypothetical protein
VLSAVSGLQVKAGLSQAAVTGITCAILVALFGIQSWGTQRIGFAFAPTVALFFLANVCVGVYNICAFEGGAIFRALSPHYIGGWCSCVSRCYCQRAGVWPPGAPHAVCVCRRACATDTSAVLSATAAHVHVHVHVHVHDAGVWFERHGTQGWMDMAGVFLVSCPPTAALSRQLAQPAAVPPTPQPGMQ